MRVKFGVAPKKGVGTSMHILNDEVDRIQHGLSSTLSDGDKKANVKYVLTGNHARLEIRVPGDPDRTSEIMRKVYEAITSFMGS